MAGKDTIKLRTKQYKVTYETKKENIWKTVNILAD